MDQFDADIQEKAKSLSLMNISNTVYNTYCSCHKSLVDDFYQGISSLESALSIFDPSLASRLQYEAPDPIPKIQVPEIFSTFQPCIFQPQNFQRFDNFVAGASALGLFSEQERKLQEEKERLQNEAEQLKEHRNCINNVITQKCAEAQAVLYENIMVDRQNIEKQKRKLLEEEARIRAERDKLTQEKLEIQKNIRDHTQLEKDIHDLTIRRKNMEKEVTTNYEKLTTIKTQLETTEEEYEKNRQIKEHYDQMLGELQKKVQEQEKKLMISKASEEKLLTAFKERVEEERKREVESLLLQLSQKDQEILKQKQENMILMNKIQQLERQLAEATHNMSEKAHQGQHQVKTQDGDDLDLDDINDNTGAGQVMTPEELVRSINPCAKYEKNFKVTNIEIPMEMGPDDKPCTDVADWASDENILQEMVEYTAKINPELIFPTEVVKDVDIHSVLGIDVEEKPRRLTNMWPLNYEAVREKDKKLYYQHYDNNYPLNVSLAKVNQQLLQNSQTSQTR